MSFVLNSFWHSLALQTFSTTVSAFLTYLLAKKCLRNWLYQRYKDNVMYKVALKESANHPWKLNCAFRIMYIPVIFKNIILSLTGKSFFIYACSLLVSITFFGFLYTMIGLNLNNISDFYRASSFEKENIYGKAKIIIGYFTILLSLTLFILICRFTHKKIAQYELEEA
jgi:uncharacterized membrane protein YdjX (TVP38/TMEM64 family)